jgi:hypothetical protein
MRNGLKNEKTVVNMMEILNKTVEGTISESNYL